MEEYRHMRVRIYPTDEQKRVIDETIGCSRFVYNHFVDANRKRGKVMSGNAMINCLPAMKKELKWLSDADAAALQQSLRDLNQAYKNHFSNPKKYGWPTFHSKKKSKLSYRTPFNNGAAGIRDGSIWLPKCYSVKSKLPFEAPSHWKTESITVERTRTGKYFASVLFSFEMEVSPLPVKNAIGLDYKSDGFFVDSNGRTVGSPKFFRKALKKLKRAQRRLKRMKGGKKGEEPSHNRQKQQLKVNRIYEKTANQRKDFLHKLSTATAKQYDTVCVEDLDLRAMSNKGFHNGKATLDNGYGFFLRMLDYKLRARGGRLVKISRWYPSSQTCHECGHVWSGTKDLSVRKWTCPKCGHSHDRDINAALNIRDEGLRVLGV